LEDVNNRLEQARDRASFSDRMVKKEFMSASQAQADLFALRKVEKDAQVLKFEYEQSVTKFTRALDEAKKNLERVKEQTKTNEKTAMALVTTTKGVYEQEKSRYHDIEDEIKKCKVYAPQDGMVVYVVPEQARFGGGAQQSIVAQGEPVREGQKMMMIPDLSEMQVKILVHEALVADVRTELPARIRIDSQSSRVYRGKVKMVATVASQAEWFAADVKKYETTVTIQNKDNAYRLKPGMSAEVEVLINRTSKDVLTIPVQAVIDPLDRGKKPTCVVRHPDGEEEQVEIDTGLSNTEKVEVRSGLEEGDQVLTNPKKWLAAHGKDKAAGAKKTGKESKFGPNETIPPAKDGNRGGGGARQGGNRQGPPQDGRGQAGGRQGGGGGFQMTPEQQKAALERWRKATPQERKQMLQQIPESFRDRVKQGLKAAGIEIPD
jgi:multidrug resistance efflux pump